MPCPFSKQAQTMVEATVPILQAGGEALTAAFYKRMFSHDPEVLAFFNPAHQKSGAQPKALATSVLAYASNLENLGALGGAIEIIAQKHCALDILPEHYPIVGRNLLAAMVDVLGSDTATPEVIDGWKEAYGFLADVLIAREKAIYDDMAARPGGWNGRRAFTVEKKELNGDSICTLVFKPADGNPLPSWQAGQYLTVYPGDSIDAGIKRPIAPRNYTISGKPNGSELRITIKREAGSQDKPEGVYSTWLIDTVKVGDSVELGPPHGVFTLNEEALKERPAVFISGGIGLTPAVPMIQEASRIAPEQKLSFFYGCADASQFAPIEEEVELLSASNKNVKTFVAYEKAEAGDKCDVVGRFTPQGVLRMASADAEFYVCGPIGFMECMIRGLKEAGVKAENIHHEAFGPMLGAVNA